LTLGAESCVRRIAHHAVAQEFASFGSQRLDHATPAQLFGCGAAF